MKLSDICKYRSEKINLNEIKAEEYISTDNMLPNFAGLGELKSFPNVEKVNKFYKNDILLSNIRPYFKKMILSNRDSGCSPDVLVIETTNQEVNPIFLYYRLRNDDFFDYVILTSKGTKMPRGDKKAIMDFELDIPNIEIQNKIVKILKSIDEKIKLNNQINDNLHEILNSLYKAWFFEHSVLETKDYSNWNFECLKDYANCILGGTPSRAKEEYWNGDVNWINSGEVNKFRILEPSERITDLGLQKSSTTLLPVGTTVLAITGATLEQVSRLEIDTCANQSVVGVISKSYLSNEYIYLSILNNIDEIIKNQTGGAQQHINKGNIEDFKILVPSKEIMEKFNAIIKPIFYKIRENCFENKNLEQLRDTLLPKLMNGEIDLDNIEI